MPQKPCDPSESVSEWVTECRAGGQALTEESAKFWLFHQESVQLWESQQSSGSSTKKVCNRGKASKVLALPPRKCAIVGKPAELPAAQRGQEWQRWDTEVSDGKGAQQHGHTSVLEPGTLPFRPGSAAYNVGGLRQVTYLLWAPAALCESLNIIRPTACRAQGTLLSALWWPKWGGNPKKRGDMCICGVITFAVQQTLTQHCKATILQKNNLKKFFDRKISFIT